MSSDYNLTKSRNSNKDLDAYIGSKVKCRRSMLGISQDKLGSHLGITFQQVQKYEKGANRVSASMLYHIADMLNVDFAFFINGFEQSKSLHDCNTAPTYDIDASKRKESADLLKAYYKINDQSTRKKILKLVKAFSSAEKKAHALSLDS